MLKILFNIMHTEYYFPTNRNDYDLHKMYFSIYLFGKISLISNQGNVMTKDPKNEMLHRIVIGIQGVELIKLLFIAIMYTPNKIIEITFIVVENMVKNLFPVK